ncbi:S8 family serine peptidase [Halopiger djelfimassiliensis]|uniref:S8 family serine peptidase n=1 Tax=Halopiger djelfimassiliensis TaxID=1293047 RepID=UPI000677B431|nr:S8 family serine peptidase [Halopiger djelfimassiliensis]
MPPNGSPKRNRRSVLKATGAFGALVGSTGITSATPGRDPGPKKSELLVGVSPTVPDAERTVRSALSGNAEIVHSNETIRYVAIEFPAQTPDEAREQVKKALENVDAIEYVEENATIESFATPNDPYYQYQHAPQQVNCEGAWGTTLGDSDVTISIVDQGIQYDHENLEENLDRRVGEVFVGGGSDPYPVDSNETHGTQVAGVAVGGTDNGTGHAGISNCSFVSARALDESGSGSLSDVADAVQWSADQGVDVINLSLGSSSHWQTLANACQYAVDQGCLVVGAAGNDGGSVSYPAAYDPVVAVSALTSSDSLASFSNRGPEIDLAAPGSRVVTTTLNDGYSRASGTSIASPVVSGVAGLVLSAYPELSPEELRDHLQQTATDVGLSSYAQGHGRVDADAAVNTVPDGYDRGDETDEEPDDEQGTDDTEGHLLAFVTEPEASWASYEFTADGPVEFTDAPYDSPSGNEIKGGTYHGDSIEENDGTWHASGVTGVGHGDAYRVDGAVTSIEIDKPDVTWVELDGEEMSPAAVIEATGGNADEDEDDDHGCGAETKSAEVESSLRSRWWSGTDRWRYSLRTADPCSTTVTLDGPSNADFDLYVTLDGSRPTRQNFDASSAGNGSDESVTVSLSGDETVRILVYATDGSGSYTLTIEERGA